MQHRHLADLVTPADQSDSQAENHQLAKFIQSFNHGGGKPADKDIQSKMTALSHGESRPHKNAPLKEKEGQLFGPDQRRLQDKPVNNLKQDYNREGGGQSGTDNFQEPL